MAKVSIEDFTREMQLETLYSEQPELDLHTTNVNRPGLQFAGYYSYFATDRLQIIGMMEMSYLQESLDSATRLERLDKFFSYPIPGVILSRHLEPPVEMMEIAKKYKVSVFRSKEVTTKLIHAAGEYLDMLLAPRITRHGVLMDVNGVGMLLVGESGIGKSETALEMIKRGHRLVADDAVEIIRVGKEELQGSAPPELRHFMEIRGVGIVDIRQLYGIGSVINHKTIHIVVQMEYWDQEKQYDRLGMDDEFITILGVKLPVIIVPVQPGRNLAIIMEVAARNYRLKRMGYNAAEVLTKRLSSHSTDEIL